MSGTPSPKNKAIVASAGSRKTTHLVDLASSASDKSILITTYTIENLDQLRSLFVKQNGCIPPNVTLLSWYAFLLRECVRPYQRAITQGSRIQSILFQDLPFVVSRTLKTAADRYYLTKNRDIYRDRVAEFVCQANDNSNGLVVARLEMIYDSILIDEVQDLSGYDLDLLDRLFASRVAVTCVGDPRQSTFSTNRSNKNKRFKGQGLLDWLRDADRSKSLITEERTDCFRCNQAICDFADKLFPGMPRTCSRNSEITGHDGIIRVERAEVPAYVAKYDPVILRHNKASDTMGYRAINFGASKGRTYARVLIFPTQPMKKYLYTEDLTGLKDLERFYVAVTRAQHSVAFVV